MVQRFEEFLTTIAETHRVLLLEGLAVIAHGLSRPTKDADAWLEPMCTSEEWSLLVLQAMSKFAGTRPYSLSARQHINPEQLASVIENDGVIRITGLNPDLDLFRIPNNLEPDQFDEVWGEASAWTGGVRVMTALDLLITKADTGRTQDQNDIVFLESKVRTDLAPKLRSATAAQAQALLSRYADHYVLSAALENPDLEVQAVAMAILKNLAADGDPYASSVLRERGQEA